MVSLVLEQKLAHLSGFGNNPLTSRGPIHDVISYSPDVLPLLDFVYKNIEPETAPGAVA